MSDQTTQTDQNSSLEQKPQARKPSVLFASPMNILDISSGAALSMRTLLAQLAGQGWNVTALGATLFDSSHGGEHVIEAGKQVSQEKKILRSQVLGINNIIVRTKEFRRADMTCLEQENYYRQWRLQLRDHRPDAIILWGGMLLEMTVMREAQMLGIPVIFYLVNSGYKWKSTFEYVSVVITDTQATAQMYWDRYQMKCHALGKFIDPSLIKATSREPKYITYINPSWEKGVNVFMPMARLAAKRYPEIKFLVVQSRGRWANALAAFKFKKEEFPNVTIIGHQKEMKKVYGVARVVLLPSTWIESGARVIPESLINGVPVIGSNTGGTAELIGEGGLVLDLPEVVKEEKLKPAPDEVAEEWLEVVHRAWHDEKFLAKLEAGVAKEAPKHEIGATVNRLLEVITPVIKAGKGDTSIKQEEFLPFPETPRLGQKATANQVKGKSKKPANRKAARAMAAKTRSKKKKGKKR